jgi:hypothetical protein
VSKNDCVVPNKSKQSCVIEESLEVNACALNPSSMYVYDKSWTYFE